MLHRSTCHSVLCPQTYHCQCTEGVWAPEEFSRAIFTPYAEAGCYGVAHWHRCCAGIPARGVAGCVTNGARDPLQSDSYPQSSAALHLNMRAHTHIDTHTHTHTLNRHSTMLCEQQKNHDVFDVIQGVKILVHVWGVFIWIRLCGWHNEKMTVENSAPSNACTAFFLWRLQAKA